MKRSSQLALIGISLICLGTSVLVADPNQKSSCVELSPDAQEFVSLVTNRMHAGTSAYLIAYLERTEDPISGRPTSGNAKGAYVVKTATGTLRIQMVDLPPGLGWAGPF